LFIYYTFVPTGTEAKNRSKINKQGCGLTRKGHRNGVIVSMEKIHPRIFDLKINVRLGLLWLDVSVRVGIRISKIDKIAKVSVFI